MSDTITVPVEIPKPPEGYGEVEWRIPQEGEMTLLCGAEWRKRLSRCPVKYFVARPLPLRGKAWLLAHAKNGFEFEYPKGPNAERYIFQGYETSGHIRLRNLHRQDWAHRYTKDDQWRDLDDIFDDFDDISDATVNILLPAIGEHNG